MSNYSLKNVANGTFAVTRDNAAATCGKIAGTGTDVAKAYHAVLMAGLRDLATAEDGNAFIMTEALRAMDAQYGYGPQKVGQATLWIESFVESHKVVKAKKGIKVIRKDEAPKGAAILAGDAEIVLAAADETPWFAMKRAPEEKPVEEQIASLAKGFKRIAEECDDEAMSPAAIAVLALRAAGISAADMEEAEKALSVIKEAEAPKLEAVA